MQNSSVKSFDSGMRMGLHRLPRSIVKKQEKGKKLSALDEFHIRALEEFNIDRDLPPEDRIQWITSFKEKCEEESINEENFTKENNEARYQMETPAKEQIRMGILNGGKAISENDVENSSDIESSPALKKCKHVVIHID